MAVWQPLAFCLQSIISTHPEFLRSASSQSTHTGGAKRKQNYPFHQVSNDENKKTAQSNRDTTNHRAHFVTCLSKLKQSTNFSLIIKD
jgi:hypothetical protein